MAVFPMLQRLQTQIPFGNDNQKAKAPQRHIHCGVALEAGAFCVDGDCFVDLECQGECGAAGFA
jgi:hypothetical protein